MKESKTCPCDSKTHEVYAIGEAPVLFLGRGYTGHEHLTEFGLINMNARLFDPLLGRFISPDPYVQASLFSQGYNRYSYCLNNPLNYSDTSGEIPFFSAIAGFLKGTVKLLSGHGHLYSPFYDAYKNTANDYKVLYGTFFKGEIRQIASRFTWELPQTMIGYLYTSSRFVVSDIDKVDYYDGATFVINYTDDTNNGITIGNFININSKNGRPTDKNGNFAPYLDGLYAHEYGHYIQSQKSGLGYIFKYGIPSLFNQIIDKENHYKYSIEIDANQKAFDYFSKKNLLITWPYSSKYPLN